MGKVVVSVEMKAPVETVFSLVKDTDKVVSFMPSGWQADVKKLTEGPIRVGTEHYIKVKGPWTSVNYKDKVEEIIGNQKIRTRSVEGFKYTKLLWIIKKHRNRTKLTREVEFTLPFGFLGRIIEKLWVERTFRQVGEKWLHNIKAHLEEGTRQHP